jgi:hypothetical protein
MSLGEKLARFFPRARVPKVRVHVLIKGRIGDGWHDIDRELTLPEGATLTELLAYAEKKGIPLRDAIDKSPHLRHTLMWNGERCPVDENLGRTLCDGDQLYLLAPLAGG